MSEYGKRLSVVQVDIEMFFFLFVDNFAVAPERSFFLSFSRFPGRARKVSLAARPFKIFSQALAATIFVSASFIF